MQLAQADLLGRQAGWTGCSAVRGRAAAGRLCRRRVCMQVRASGATAPPHSSNVLQKVARVLREKAAQDMERIMQGTSKTREKLGVVEELFAYWRLEDADSELEELEDALIMSDFGPRTSFRIVDQIREQVRDGQLKTGEDIRSALKASILGLLQQRGGSAELDLPASKPAVVLVVGVNGGGKTTTIGKLAHRFASTTAASSSMSSVDADAPAPASSSGRPSVVLAAGDTFRAAATEQLEEWARRSGAALVRAPSDKTRPDTVLFTAVQQAARDGADLVLCDTSGRLHTNYNLMDELAKCKRSVGKALVGAPHEVLLVLDGTTGLNMLNQAREFHEAVGVTGLILTKLDGSARGGAVVSVVDELGLPVKFVGVGEGLEDLQPFDAAAFVDALFPSGGGDVEAQ